MNNYSDIEDWYWNHQEEPLNLYLCVERALKKGDNSCIFNDDLDNNEQTNNDHTKERKPNQEL